MVSYSMWQSLVFTFIFVVSSQSKTFTSPRELNEYFEDRYNNSQEIDSHHVFQIFPLTPCKMGVRILLSGEVSTIKYNNTSSTVYTGNRIADPNTTLPVSRPKNGHLYMSWFNGSHHSPYLANELSPPLEFGHVEYNASYKDNKLLEVGFFDLDVSWSSALPGSLKGSTIHCFVLRSNAGCKYDKHSGSVRVTNLPSKVAITNNVFVQLLVLEGRRDCNFTLPAIVLSSADCSVNGLYCKPPCLMPDNVVNASYEVLNNSLLIGWSPPRYTGEISAYLIRWGLLESGSLDFPLSTTEGAYYQESVYNESRQSIHIPMNEEEDVLSQDINIQIVALCSERNLKLLKEIKDTRTFYQQDLKLLDDLFVPARSDIKIYHSTELEGEESITEEHNVDEEDVKISQQRDGQSTVVEISGGRWAEIAAPVVVVLLLLVLVITVAAVVQRRRSQRGRNLKPSDILTSRMKANPIYHSLYVDMSEADKWEILPEFVEWGEEIGFGAFGCVFKCSLLDEKFVDMSFNYSTVAVKTLAENCNDIAKHQFIQEILVMKELREHPNILQLIGCVTSSDPICLIMEYALNGDLLSFLHSQRELEGDHAYHSPGVTHSLTYSRLLQMAVEISSGMDYISSKGYVHRDLAARNILLDGFYTVKIGDFGLARCLNSDDIYTVQTSKRLPVKWLSIEALIDLTFSTASDVWAFGVVLFELVSLGETPYASIDPTDMLTYLNSGKRIEKPSKCSDSLYELMRNCWQTKPSARPSFTELTQLLTELHSDQSQHDVTEANQSHIDVAAMNQLQHDMAEINQSQCELADINQSLHDVTKMSQSKHDAITMNQSQRDVTDSTSVFSVHSDDDLDEGFVPDSPPPARIPLTSESSNFSEVNMIITSPELGRKRGTDGLVDKSKVFDTLHSAWLATYDIAQQDRVYETFRTEL